MKVLSLIKPRHRDVRNVTVNGTPYAFARQPDGEFAAEVEDSTDLHVFGRSPHFRIIGKSSLANPRAPAKTPEPPVEKKEADDGGDAEKSISPLEAEAQALLQGSAADIGRDIGSVSSLDVLRRAIEIEQAEGGKQRKGVDTMLRQALAAAEQAGVTLP